MMILGPLVMKPGVRAAERCAVGNGDCNKISAGSAANRCGMSPFLVEKVP